MILIVTSLVGGAGRSTLSRGLAAALARGGRTVAWVGADISAGPDVEGVDASLRATASGEALPSSIRPVHRIGVADDEDFRWARSRPHARDVREDGWEAILPAVSRLRDLVVIDAPRLFDASELIERADSVLFLLPLDRAAPSTLDPLLRELERLRTRNSKLRLDGIALTRVDATRPGVLRELEAAWTLAPPRAFMAPLVPEGAGPAREGAIEELASVWARRAGLPVRVRRPAGAPLESPLDGGATHARRREDAA